MVHNKVKVTIIAPDGINEEVVEELLGILASTATDGDDGGDDQESFDGEFTDDEPCHTHGARVELNRTYEAIPVTKASSELVALYNELIDDVVIKGDWRYRVALTSPEDIRLAERSNVLYGLLMTASMLDIPVGPVAHVILALTDDIQKRINTIAKREGLDPTSGCRLVFDGGKCYIVGNCLCSW